MTINLDFETEKRLELPLEEIITEICGAVIAYEHCPFSCEISVLFTDDEGIRIINRDSRGIDAPTDVLSFPMAEYESPGDFSIFREGDPELFNPDTGDFFLGDIVLNLDRIESQAREYGHSERRELAFLTAHSMLHLFGYDHMAEGERSEMERRQREILEGKGYCR